VVQFNDANKNKMHKHKIKLYSVSGIFALFGGLSGAYYGDDLGRGLYAMLGAENSQNSDMSVVSQAASEKDRVPGQYIVVFKDDAGQNASAQSFVESYSVETTHTYSKVFKGMAARMSTASLAKVLSDPRVAYVVEDRIVKMSSTTKKPSTTKSTPTLISKPTATPKSTSSTARPAPQAKNKQTLPTGIDRINAEKKINTGADINVAVVDTGIDLNHPDLKANIAGGKNCSTGTTYNDGHGHGTHVAGTIAALDNLSGVVGVAPNAKLWAVRVLDNNGSGTWSSVICGIDFITSNAPANGGKITLANMSLGGSGTSDNNCGNTNNDPFHKAICRSRDAGVTYIVAAGNSGTDASLSVPASYDDAVITVSALADSDGKAGGTGKEVSGYKDDTFPIFSNFGKVVDIAAPGVNILSTTKGGGTKSLTGTSMATPHVTGAAALYLKTNPGSSWTQIKDALISLAEKLGAGHTDPSGKHPEPVVRADTL